MLERFANSFVSRFELDFYQLVNLPMSKPAVNPRRPKSARSIKVRDYFEELK